MSAEKRKQKRITSIEVAKYLGVSVSTVSRAFNDRSDISKETQKRVLKAARELNYTPNETARNLVTQTNKTIAAIIPDIQNPYYSEIIKNIDKVLRFNNYSLILSITNESDKEVDYYLGEMIKKRISGILLLNTVVKNKPLLEKVKRNTALVSVSASNEGTDEIVNEDKEGTYKIVKHLIEQGHKRIAFVGYKTEENETLKNRLKGYREALEDFDLIFEESLVIDCESANSRGYSAVEKIMQIPNRPTAIHCMNDYLAMGVYLAVSDRGMKIPDDISLSAFGGLEVTKLIRPRLTTVRTPIAQLGQTAAKLLLQRIESDNKQENELVVLPSIIFIGDSTAAPRSVSN